MIYYEHCCFWKFKIKSRTFAKIIAILGIVSTPIYFIFGCINYGVYYNDFERLKENSPHGNYFRVLEYLSIDGIMALLAVFFLLLRGLDKNKPHYIVPFLTFNMVHIIVSSEIVGLSGIK